MNLNKIIIYEINSFIKNSNKEPRYREPLFDFSDAKKRCSRASLFIMIFIDYIL